MIRHLILVGILGLGLVACGDDVGTAPRIALDAGLAGVDAGLAGVDAGAIDAEAVAVDSRPAVEVIAGCSLNLSASAWIAPQHEVFEHSTVGLLAFPDVDGTAYPVVGKMCWAHSSDPTNDGFYLVESIGGEWENYPGSQDPQSYFVETHARIAKLAH
jgi:hypothetical protein